MIATYLVGAVLASIAAYAAGSSVRESIVTGFLWPVLLVGFVAMVVLALIGSFMKK